MAYNPSLHTVTNKALGVGQGNPTDARSYYYDDANFIYRPYASTAEVIEYLDKPQFRKGQFSIIIDDGVTVSEWWFKDGTAEGDLVEKIGAGGIPNLQEVTDVGNVTDNGITIQDDVGYAQLQILHLAEQTVLANGILNINDGDGNYSTLSPAQLDLGKSSGNATLFINNLTAFRAIELPNAAGTLALSVNGTPADATGNITIAVGGSIPSLQQVTDAGFITTNPIVGVYPFGNISFGFNATEGAMMTIGNSGGFVVSISPFNLDADYYLRAPKRPALSTPTIVVSINGVLADNTGNVVVPTGGGTKSIGVNLDGQGFVLTTGQKGYIRIPYAGTITGWSIISDVTGSCVFDVWKAAGVKPTVADTITAGAKPTLTAADVASSTTLTGWTTAVAAGDIIGWNLDSVSTITTAFLQLTLEGA